MSDEQSDHIEVICEAGVNHNGSLERALTLVEKAAEVGADVVKFQTFRPEAMVTAQAPKAAYQERNAPENNSQYDMLKALALDADAHVTLKARAEAIGIGFLSTPFDSGSLRLLTKGLGLRRVKVSSGDLTNAPLLLEIAQSQVDVVVSTGMATIDEIEEALSVLAFGYIGDGSPSRAGFREALAAAEGQTVLKRRVTLLHCTSDYPAQLTDVNLRAMDSLVERFGLRTGYSDHTLGIAVSIAAASRGAVVIEKHMTLDRALPGPDHKASLEPQEFAAMVEGIRAVTAALGSREKRVVEAEKSTRLVARKSIVAARSIAEGETFTLENLTTKRAGGGLPPVGLWDIVGRHSARAYSVDDVIEA